MHHSLRPKFVKFVQQLELCEPQEVTPPGEDEFPVPELPIFHGLRCNFGACGHLCLTEKRMKSHYTATNHPYVATKKPWSPVSVQTFFRGNLLKYFAGPPQFRDVQLRPGAAEEANDSLRNHDNSSCGPQLATSTSNLPTTCATGRQECIDVVAERLLRHYQTSTYTTIATGIDDQVLWQQTVTQIAREHEFVLLAVLAVTSLHIAQLNPDHRSEYALQAASYQDRAMPLFRKNVANANSDNCHAILVFLHFLVLYTLAAEQHDDDLLLVTREDDQVVPIWLHFIRSACVMLCDVWDWVEAGPCSVLASAWDAPFNISKAYNESILDKLLTLIPPTSSERAWDPDAIRVYKEAASELALAFACSESSPKILTTWDLLRIWPVRISAEFMTLLHQEHPCALILLAHYSMLLRRIGLSWYFGRRADGLLRTIHRKLDPYWYSSIPPVLRLVMDRVLVGF